MMNKRGCCHTEFIDLSFVRSKLSESKRFGQTNLQKKSVIKIILLCTFFMMPPLASAAVQIDVKKITETIKQEQKEWADIKGNNESKIHVLVTFNKQPSTQILRNLEKIGARDVAPVTLLSRIIEVVPNSILALVKEYDVSSISLVSSGDKLSLQTQNMSALKWTHRKGANNAYNVIFHSGTNSQEVKNLANAMGVSLEGFNFQAFPVVRYATFVATPEVIEKVADYPNVLRVEPFSGPDSDNNAATSQPTTNVDAVQAAPYSLTGTGINVGIWEANDVVLATHLDLSPRVTIATGQVSRTDNHAAHVAGTIGGSGQNVPLAEGMAVAVNMTSFDSNLDANEMTTNSTSTASPRIQISNHSYSKGDERGWNADGNVFVNNINRFGTYDANTTAFDSVVIANDLIVMKSAGNDRQHDWDGVVNIDVDWDGDGVLDGTPPNDCRQNNFTIDADCITPTGSAKNVITVGAVANSTTMWSGSAFGPTDDGRIKPDIMATGSNTISLNSGTNTAFGANSGTSMSTPVLTGIAALVLEEAANQGITITAAGMKAILLQTAQDVTAINDPSSLGGSALNAAQGPDYATGYGIADAKAAIDLLRRSNGPGLIQDSIASELISDQREYKFYVEADDPEMHVTLAWTDPASAAAATGAQLVNNLELTLIEPDGITTHTPWALNPLSPGDPAVRNGGADAINNVEQVSVENPVEGLWTARVSATGGLSQGLPQAFALAGPLTNERSDIMLVMDRSGSMGWNVDPLDPTSETKLDALQNAAEQFIDIIELSSGHQLGLLQFEETVVPFIPPFDLQNLDSTTANTAKTMTLPSMSAGGWTNMIDAVTQANTQFSATSDNSRKVIVLFSDGQHNRPVGSDLNDIDTIMDSDVDFFSIGFGQNVDDNILAPIASRRNGIHQNEVDLDSNALAKIFITAAGLAVNETVNIDPDYNLGVGQTALFKTVTTAHDKSITFSTNWETSNDKSLVFNLTGPSNCRIRLVNDEGVKVRHGKSYQLTKVKLPYSCANGEKIHSGEWKLSATAINVDQKDKREAVKIMTLVDTDIKMTAQINNTKEPILEVKLPTNLNDISEFNVYAMVNYSQPSDKKFSAIADNPKLNNEDANNFRKKQLDIRADNGDLETMRIKLVDNGRNGDKEANDGIFSVVLPVKSEGLYQIRVIANANSENGEIQRESYTSFYYGK